MFTQSFQSSSICSCILPQSHHVIISALFNSDSFQINQHSIKQSIGQSIEGPTNQSFAHTKPKNYANNQSPLHSNDLDRSNNQINDQLVHQVLSVFILTMFVFCFCGIQGDEDEEKQQQRQQREGGTGVLA